MLKITRAEGREVVFRLSGRMDGENVAELKELFGQEALVVKRRSIVLKRCFMYDHQPRPPVNGSRRSAKRGGRACDGYRSMTVAQTRSEGERWDAVQEIFLASRSRFIRLAYSILRNKEDAEDAVQDALLSAYSHLNTFEGRSALTTWFTRIVLNAALVIRRKRKTCCINSFPNPSNTDDIHWTETILASQPDPEMLYMEKETFQLVDGLVEEMTPILRQALTTTYYDEKSNNEACALLGVKKGTFNSRLSRATRRLTNQVRRFVASPIRGAAHSTFIPGRNDFQTLAARRAQVSPLEIGLS